MLTKLRLLATVLFSRDVEKSRQAEITLFGGGLASPTPDAPKAPDSKGQHS